MVGQISVYNGQNICYNIHEMISGTVPIEAVFLAGMLTVVAKKDITVYTSDSM